jgi:uncharacterized damage-inducible protein DinB
MQIRELLLPEVDDEMRKTRATLERVPEGVPDFKPHTKSMPMARLAAHLAQLPVFGSTILSTPELDFSTSGMQPLTMESREQLLRAFDGHVQQTRAKLAEASDDELQQPWKLSFGGKVIVEGTRYQVLRTLMINHIIHHRAQLGVYLRLNEIPVPAIYGPTADEVM